MGKTSKFSFPLPGRRHHFNRTSESLALPEEPKLSKIERLLGTTDLPPQYQVAANKNPLQSLGRQPSSLTLSLYESTIADGRSDLDSPIPDVPALPKVSTSTFEVPSPWASQVSLTPPRSVSVSQVQSPRLTEDALRRNHPRSQSSHDILSIQHGKLQRSTTNGGHSYTAIRIDSAGANVQEQPSGSRQASSNSHKLFPVVESTFDEVPATESYPLSGYKPGAKPTDKKRPTRLDLSKLLSRSASASTTPLKTVTSPNSSNLTHNPPRFPSDVRNPSDVTSPPLKMSMSRRIAKKANFSSTRVSDQTETPKMEERNDVSASAGVKIVSRKSRTSKHWFDGLLEAEDTEIPELDSADEQPAMTAASYIDLAVTHSQNQEKRMQNNRLSTRQSPPSEAARPKSQGNALEVPTAHSGAARCIRPTCSERLERIMQKQPSPLIPEFSPVELPSFEAQSKRDDLPIVRDSIAMSDVGETIAIGEATALHVRPQRRLDAVETVHVKRMVQPSQLQIINISPTKKSIGQASPEPPEDVPEMQFSQHQSENHRYVARSRSSSNSARTSLRSDRSLRSDPKHKMMAVTPEEEALLAMMRQKRAAMQSHSFAEGFKSALMSSPQSPNYLHVSHLSRNNSSNNKVHIDRGRRSPGMSLMSPRANAHIQHRLATETAMVAPQPLRVHNIMPEGLAELGLSGDLKAQPTAPMQVISDPEEALATSPETGHSTFHSSPSEKSIRSGTQSPVTPHSASASIKIAMSSVDPEPWLKLDDFPDQASFDFSYVDPSDQSLVSDNTKFADVPIAAARSLVDDQSAACSSMSGSSHIIQQLKNNAMSNLSRSNTRSTRKSQPFNTGLTARSHEHKHGCCGSADTRCSVANDVMAAWTSLGGWQEQRTPLH